MNANAKYKWRCRLNELNYQLQIKLRYETRT